MDSCVKAPDCEPIADWQSEPRLGGVSPVALIVAGGVSILIHLAALWYWNPGLAPQWRDDAHSGQPLEITLQRAAKPPQAAPEPEPSTREIERAPTPKKVATSEREPVEPVEPVERDTQPPPSDVDYNAYQTPAATERAPRAQSTGVFDPKLRAKLHEAKATQTGPAPSATAVESYIDVAGATQVKLDNRCFRAQRAEGRGFARDWYMTGCNESNGEAERMLDGVRRRLKSPATDAQHERR